MTIKKARKPKQKAGQTKIGRPAALKADKKTLLTIRGLGRIQANSKEIAAVLGVCEQTWITFKEKYKDVIEQVLEEGKGLGCVGLRRRQFQMARTNVTMAIFLGKQYLGQVDKHEFNQNVVLTDERSHSEIAETIESKLARIAAQGGEGEVLH